MNRHVVFPIEVDKWHLLTGAADVAVTPLGVMISWTLVPSRGWIIFHDARGNRYFKDIASPGMEDGLVDLSNSLPFTAIFAQQRRNVLLGLMAKTIKPEALVTLRDELRALDEAVRRCSFPPPLKSQG